MKFALMAKLVMSAVTTRLQRSATSGYEADNNAPSELACHPSEPCYSAVTRLFPARQRPNVRRKGLAAGQSP
jgi:hypothetical protein